MAKAHKFTPKYNLFNLDRPVVRRYVDYVRKRNQVWAQKYVHKTPVDYEGDEVLRANHFCNIWRETDKFSREEITRLRKLKSFRDQVRLVLLARHSLVWETVDLLMNGIEVKALRRHWNQVRGTENGFVSRAITFYPREGNDRALELVHHRDQVDQYLDEIVASFNDRTKPALYYFAKIPQMFDVIGQFRAYEMFISLTYSQHVHYREDDVFLVGPGAVGGLNYVSGYEFGENDINAALMDLRVLVKDYLEQQEWFTWIPEELQGSVNHKEQHKFTVRTLEDTLCEFRKYENIASGKTTPRRKYRGHV